VIVLDASVLIAHLDANDVCHERATMLLLEVAGEQFTASHLTLAEILMGPARAGEIDRAVAALTQLGIAGVGLNADSPARLAALRARTGLKLPDCCVLLVAQDVQGKVATFDDRLTAAARDHGLGVRD
jgi:predicted nucleic acid-binding protein